MFRNATPGPEELVDHHQIRAEDLYMRGIAQSRSDSECNSLECVTRRGRPVQAAKYSRPVWATVSSMSRSCGMVTRWPRACS